MRRRHILIVALAWAACSPNSVRLVVDLKSDLVPGAEVFEVRVSLPDEARELDPIPLERDSPLSSPGVRIAELTDLSATDSRRLRAAALDIRGEETVAVEVLVANETDAVVTVVLSRDCRGVECPGDGAVTATRCLAERCVEPDCLTGAEAACPDAECANDGDCPSTVCTVGRCDDGVCLETDAPGACGANEFCNPARGCMVAPELLEGGECDLAPYVQEPVCEGDCALRVVDVAASEDHSCVVAVGGDVLCFGSNDEGALGTGDTYGRLRPSRVPLEAALDVAVGDGFSCALLMDSSIRCWGDGARGTLGLGDFASRLVPGDAVAGGPWKAVLAGNDNACAIDMSDALYCWGDNSEGQLGVGSSGAPMPTPTRVDDTRWRGVEVGQGHVCGIRVDNTLQCWGRNSDANLGLPEGSAMQIQSPTQVGTDADWRSVDCGQTGCCATKTDSSLLCWGEQSFGSLGLGGGDGLFYGPQLRGDGMDWSDVGLSVFHGCGIRSADAWCWGRAIEGQLGVRQSDPQPTPVMVIPGSWARVTIGRFSSFLVRDDGALFATGANCGRLGTGELARPHAFTEVSR